MDLRIITAEKEELNTMVSGVRCPGFLGEFEILPGHTQFVSILKAGDLHYFGPSAGKYSLKSGLLSVRDNKITILVGG
jgi:F-type H+-transporting ATPase subunit epsilon